MSTEMESDELSVNPIYAALGWSSVSFNLQSVSTFSHVQRLQQRNHSATILFYILFVAIYLFVMLTDIIPSW